MSDYQQLASSLKQAGHSLTKPRKTVFGALSRSEPMTVQALIAACPTINRASVYRTIDLFERLGIIQRLQIGWKYKIELSDRFQQHHHHLTCLVCGRVIGLAEDTALEARLKRLARVYGFDMSSHQLEMQGSCAQCRL